MKVTPELIAYIQDAMDQHPEVIASLHDLLLALDTCYNESRRREVPVLSPPVGDAKPISEVIESIISDEDLSLDLEPAVEGEEEESSIPGAVYSDGEISVLPVSQDPWDQEAPFSDSAKGSAKILEGSVSPTKSDPSDIANQIEQELNHPEVSAVTVSNYHCEKCNSIVPVSFAQAMAEQGLPILHKKCGG